jgi:hypothetical protein
MDGFAFLVSWLFRVGGMAGLFATVDLCRIGFCWNSCLSTSCLQPLVAYAVLSDHRAAVEIRAVKDNTIMV